MAPNPRKRPFQPTIDTFFGRAGRSDFHTQQHQEPWQPYSALPPDIQSSLLSVGMRIRKAVPEGYKTHRPPPPPSSSSGDRPVAATARPAELLPFCGLHKVGGLGVQDGPVDAFAYADAGPSSSLFSSQESCASAVSTDSLPARKRLCPHTDEEEDEDEGEEEQPGFALHFDGDAAFVVDADFGGDVPLSSRSGGNALQHVAWRVGQRQFAMPRTRTRRKGGVLVDENTRPEDVDGGDFGEAGFLRAAEWEGEGMDLGGF